jgi:cell division protein FtsL
MRAHDIAVWTSVGRDRTSSVLKPRIDQIRKFDLLQPLLMGGLVLVGILSYAWQPIQVVRLGYQVEDLTRERADLMRQQEKLRLEVARLGSLRRVEEIARQQLAMTSPASGQVVVIESLPSRIIGNDVQDIETP